MPLYNSTQGNSPTYFGYEYTKPEINVPTGLLSLTSLVSKGGTEGLTGETETEAKVTKKGSKGETLIIPGIYGTAKSLAEQSDIVDAEISSIQSKMRNKFKDTKTYPTREEFIKGVSPEYSELQKAYAKKYAIESQIPLANQKLIDWNDAKKALNEKDKGAAGETAMTMENGVLIPAGTIDKNTGKYNTYNQVHNQAFYNDETGGTPEIKNPNNYDYIYGQKGAFDKQITDEFKEANKIKMTTGYENLQTAGYYVGMIITSDYSTNTPAINTARDLMYEKLSTESKADIASKMFDDMLSPTKKAKFVKDGVITADQAKSIDKKATGEALTDDDYVNIDDATKAYAGNKIVNESKKYYEILNKQGLKSGGKGSGSGIGNIEPVKISKAETVKFKILNKGATKTDVSEMPVIDGYNFGTGAKYVTVSTPFSVDPDNIEANNLTGEVTIKPTSVKIIQDPYTKKQYSVVAATNKDGIFYIPFEGDIKNIIDDAVGDLGIPEEKSTFDEIKTTISNIGLNEKPGGKTSTKSGLPIIPNTTPAGLPIIK